MAPIRRYLRLTKYSVLECRIYLDNPAHAARWLLHTADPALPRVMAAVRPLVLPKLREERERRQRRRRGGASGSGSAAARRRGIKDSVAGPDFEVSVFLTDSRAARHSLLARRTRFTPKVPRPLQSTSHRLLGHSAQDPVLLEEEEGEGEGEERVQEGVRSGSPVGGDDDDDKKDLAMEVSYDGFAIHGLVLCLVVRRRADSAAKATTAEKRGRPTDGHAVMENWISSTQQPQGPEDL